MNNIKEKLMILGIIILVSTSIRELHAQTRSSFYTKGIGWQETITNSIKSFHFERERLNTILIDESIIDLGDWYSVGPFFGEPEKLFSIEFEPERNKDLDQIFEGGQKWMAHPDWKDGMLHFFEGMAIEVNYVRRTIQLSQDMDILAYVSSDDGLHLWLNDELIFKNNTDRGLEPNQEFIPLKLKKGLNSVMLKINNRGNPQGFFFSLLPSADVYRIEMEKIWTQLAIDFPDDHSIFQIEREKKDGIWNSQVHAYDEIKIIENYINKIKRIPSIAVYSENYLKSASGKIDIDIIRGLYYLTCKFDNILYLDDSHEKNDEAWNDYKSKFKSQALEVAAFLTMEKNKEQLSKASKKLDDIFNNIPLRLPSGLNSNGRFGAYYTSLKYDLEWDKHWRIGDHADIVVDFEKAGYKFVFWRGTSYIPCWVTKTGIWYTNEFVERRGFHSANTEGCVEPMSDKQCRYSHVRIIENTDARVVIHWRYAPIDVNYQHPFTDPNTGWSDWVDEVYTIYPSGISVRKITIQTNRPDLWTEFQEAIVINQPGTMPEDNIELGAMSLANMQGQSKTYYWTEEGAPEFDNAPEFASIFKVNLKAPYSPFALVTPPDGDGLITSYLGHAPSSNFHFWNHWPVSQDASDGRIALSAARPSHSSLGHIGLTGMADTEWKPFKLEGKKVTKIMLHGMTDESVENLVPLGKSWLSSPELILNSSGYISQGYDPSQAAYLINKSSSDNLNPLSLTINASKNSPLVNPAFVIKNWINTDAVVKMNGITLKKSIDYQIGYDKTFNGNNLIIWLEMQSESILNLRIE
jgi:hypothetical protein